MRIDLSDPRSLYEIDESELVEVVAMINEELKKRALENNDLDALLEQGFEQGFGRDAKVMDPIIKDGLLICYGAKLDRSASTHFCNFVHTGETWVWDDAEKICDSIRNPPNPKPLMRSVTILPAREGMELDLIESRTKMGVHERVSIKSFIIKNTELVTVSDRKRKVDNHR